MSDQHDDPSLADECREGQLSTCTRQEHRWLLGRASTRIAELEALLLDAWLPCTTETSTAAREEDRRCGTCTNCKLRALVEDNDE